MLPRILFFNINGSGMGHMNRCLAYACALRGKAEMTFFSLASAVEIIEGMGFNSEYYVSQFWSTNSNYTWNSELAFRLTMVLEHVQPHIIVFDGTWPYHGFLGACMAYGKAKIVWSRRGLFKKGAKVPPIDPNFFDLILEPGELLSAPAMEIKNKSPLQARNTQKELVKQDNTVHLSPVTLLKNEELLHRDTARKELDLEPQKKYALLSLGPGNLRNVHSVGHICIELLQEQGYTVLWACAPISVNDVALPNGVIPITIYPLVRVLRAFDLFLGAAGYNTCCEVVQAQVPTLLLPNTLLADDQTRRAHLVAENSPTVVCLSEKKEDIQKALEALASLKKKTQAIPLHGAEEAAQALLQLVDFSDTAKNIAKSSKYHAHTWHCGPTWAYIKQHYGALAKLKTRTWLGEKLYTLINMYKTYGTLRPHAWQANLKHSANSAQQVPQTLLLLAKGLQKNEQRILCQNLQNYLQQTKKYIPVLVTDTPDFAFFARLHWLVEYVPHLQERQDADYKKQKSEYLLWRYREAIVMPLTQDTYNSLVNP